MIKIPSKVEKIHSYNLTSGVDIVFQINLSKRTYFFKLKKNKLEGELTYNNHLLFNEPKYFTKMNNKFLEYMNKTNTNIIHLTPKPENHHSFENDMRFIRKELSDHLNCDFNEKKQILEISKN